MTEFARVLRPGGHAIISNIHHLSLPLGGTIEMALPDGRQERLPCTPFLPWDYITAALNSGFQIQSCREVLWSEDGSAFGGPMAQTLGAEAAHLAYTMTPALIAIELMKTSTHTQMP
jgi:hypothetical protein